ncbi:MAG TPA: hypothetical protein VK191_10215 [Symbiobacteriaceae bacterium]|nr:hypothetical protein [Symbiobacteriaceae bacterium]
MGRRTITEGVMVECSPVCIVMGTTDGYVTIPRRRICRVERICLSVTVR